jgi:hypothetical protein
MRLIQVLLGIVFFASYSMAQVINGFDVSGASIPPSEIFRGGPPRDGIPAIDQPVFISSKSTDLDDQAYVLGINFNGVAKAFPINIMNYHEIVNDDFGGDKVVITYCPLCGSGIGFKSTLDGKALTFGVSGLLYNSDVLLYDRQTESLWSQIMSLAVTGPMKGTVLCMIPTENTTWGNWKRRFPESMVLSEKTGHARDYSRTPYIGYDKNENIYFPVSANSNTFHPKEKVIGVSVNGKYKAYPFSELAKIASPIEDTFAKKNIIIYYDAKTESARATASDGEQLHYFTAFWFAWYTFHPRTKVFKAGK